uniref:CCHC-type domain-containing protein n=1 Tax=Aegilops tauschii subsp. strangulata TaxID=200361 RepID=A0A453GYS5_AEGTS
MEEFISLGGDEPEPRASEDLDQPQVQAQVDLNLNLNHAPPPKTETEPLPSHHQPQDSGVVVLEEGQIACQESSSAAAVQDAQAKAQEEALLRANGVGPPPPSRQQPQATKAAACDDIIDLEEGQVEDMDLSDDNAVVVVVTKQHGAVSAETPKGNNVGPSLSTPNSAFIDQSPTRGVKRARAESTEPSVRVVYNNLTRESKRKLMELMQQWSEWQARKQHASTETVEQVLDCGEETYYPALHVGSERSCAVSFWVDSQARGNAAVDDGAVPLYDREFTLGSTPMGDSSNAEGKKDKDDSRCFNCGSYSHALKDCPKPRDHVAISNARKQHNLKRNLSNVGNRGQNRYYQKTPGKFDDLKAGVLGSETRECLGLRENDPPPWLHRMRELGYPPGYLGKHL